MRLPPPERADGEHDEMPVAEAGVDHRGSIGQKLTVGEGPRQQQLTSLGPELDDDAGARCIARGRSTLRALAYFCAFVRPGPLVRPGVALAASIRFKG